jgi:hypothetical protein
MTRNVLVVAMISLGAASVPAAAQVNLNMNQITCRDWLGYDPESQNFVRYWMSGYYTASRTGNVLDFNRLQRNSQSVLAYCKKHRSDTLPTAIQKSAI